MSGITLLGVSMEIYQYGAIFVLVNLGYGIGTPLAIYYFLPVFFKLQSTSAYKVCKIYLRFIYHLNYIFFINEA